MLDEIFFPGELFAIAPGDIMFLEVSEIRVIKPTHAFWSVIRIHQELLWNNAVILWVMLAHVPFEAIQAFEGLGVVLLEKTPAIMPAGDSCSRRGVSGRVGEAGRRLTKGISDHTTVAGTTVVIKVLRCIEGTYDRGQSGEYGSHSLRTLTRQACVIEPCLKIVIRATDQRRDCLALLV